MSEYSKAATLAKTDGAINTFLDDAAKITYKVRTGGPTEKNESGLIVNTCD